MAQRKPSAPIAVTQLPSADLVQFRFDKLDEAFEKLDKKMDDIVSNTVTKEEATLLVAERNEKIQQLKDDFEEEIKTIKDQMKEDAENRKWLNRKIIGSVIAAFFLSLGSLLVALLLKSHVSLH